MEEKFPYIGYFAAKYKHNEAVIESVSILEPGITGTSFLKIHGEEAIKSVEAVASELSASFVGLNEAYLLWQKGQQRCFTSLTFNDAGKLIMEVSVAMLGDVVANGRQIHKLLQLMKGKMAEQNTIDALEFWHMAENAGFSQQPMVNSTDEITFAAEAPVAYRTYSSAADLVSLLGFCRQGAYSGYGAVALVDSSVMPDAKNEMPLVNEPLDKSLFVVCPEGVEASAARVNYSDNLHLTYLCKGFDPVTVSFEVGSTNRYVRINGSALIVNNARYAGIVFLRRVPFSVKTSTDDPIDTFTILINSRTANRTNDDFEISQLDFTEGGVATVSISSTNFSSYTRQFTPEQLDEAMPLDVVLEPEERRIELRLDFGDGRIVVETLNIEKNTPEYCQLRAGRFHGFRAHRLVGVEPETFNVDVRYRAPQPVAQQQQLPLTDVAAAEDTPVKEDAPVQPVAPVIEKAPSAINDEEEVGGKPVAPEFINETIESDETTDNRPGKRRLRRGIIWKLALLVVLLGVAGWLIGKGGCGREGVVADSVGADSIAPGVEATTAEPATVEELADVEYLNSTRFWHPDQLRSQKYRDMIQNLAANNVDALVQCDYFAVEGRCTNTDALKIIDLVWKAKGSHQEKSQRKVLEKNVTDKEEIDLHKLMEELAKKMPPAADVNNAPRPVHK